MILLFLCTWPMLAALLGYVVGKYNKTVRNFFADAAVIIEFVVAITLIVRALNGGSDLYFTWNNFCGLGLNLMLDGFRALYGTVAAFMWMMTTIFSREYFAHYKNRNRYYMFMLLTLGATMGVFLSADLYSTFIFFEIMSFTSYVWVAHDEKKEAMRAAETYLAVAIIGGLVMLMGLFLLYDKLGTLSFSELLINVQNYSGSKNTIYLAGALCVFGFGAKAGMFPLHIWLPKAHPVAPAPSSALLSGILTKSGIFGIIAITCNLFLHDGHWGIVITLLGVITMFGGALLAVFSVDFKRTLACSSMSQIGFILIGIGMQCMLATQNALAIGGTVLHMLNHSLIKLDLFMVAGVIYMNIHKLNLNDIRGFGKKKPLLMACYLCGALSIAGIPMFSGYISKTLLHESIVEYSHESLLIGSLGLWKAIEWIFLISGGMTLAYMLKLFIAVFVEKNESEEVQNSFDEKKVYWNVESKIAVIGSALLLPLMGIIPKQTMNKLAELSVEFMHGEPIEGIHYFSLENLKGAVISITIGCLIYFGFIRTCLMVKTENGTKEYVNRWPEWLDLENLIYRPLILKVLPGIIGFICAIASQITDTIIILIRRTTHKQHLTPSIDLSPNKLAIRFGSFVDKIKKNDKEHSVVPSLIQAETHIESTQRIVSGSVAFGLILACVGILLVLIYLLQFA